MSNENKKMSLRDRLRAKTVGAKKHFKKTLVEANGETFELRQPTVKERSDLRAKCAKINPEAKNDEDKFQFDIFEFLIWAVIEATYVPNTDEKVFTEEDYDALMALPAGGWFDDLSTAASELFNVKDSEEAKKN